MKVRNRAVLETRQGSFLVLRLFNDAVWVVSSQSDGMSVVKARGRSLVENFLDATSEIKDILPSEVAILAIGLGIELPHNIAVGLSGGNRLIESLAHALHVDTG